MKIQILACLFALTLFAEEYPFITKLQNGVFIGLGGNYNSVKIDQQLNGTEFSSVFSGSSLVALGESGGAANPYHATYSTWAPQAQLGYLYRFSNRAWFLSCKAVYQYLGVTFTENNLDSFQPGTYTTVGGGGDTWIGHVLINSSQTHVNHELFLLPIFGYFFNESSAYFGAGPVVFETQNNLYGIRGFARVNGTASDITGSPANCSFSQWMWGGVIQIGWIYPFTSGWFLDLNYNYAATANTSAQDTVLFSNSLITGTVYAEEGVAFVKIKQRVTAQSFAVTVNKAF